MSKSEKNNLDTLNEMLEKKKQNAMSKEEYFAKYTPQIDNRSFRLEMFYIPEKDIFVIQGDENGLKHFGEMILALAHPDERAGHHIHWDESTTTRINIRQLITQRTNTDNDDSLVDHT
jgi:hypothetical protein